MSKEDIKSKVDSVIGKYVQKEDVNKIEEVLQQYTGGTSSPKVDIEPIRLTWTRQFSTGTFAVLKRLDDIKKMMDELEQMRFALSDGDIAIFEDARGKLDDAIKTLDTMKVLETFPDFNEPKVTPLSLKDITPKDLGTHLVQLGKKIDNAYRQDVERQMYETLSPMQKAGYKIKKFLLPSFKQ